MARPWTGSAPNFHLKWGGQTWTLRVDGPNPGLYDPSGACGPLLALEGLAEAGRWSPRALSGATLIGCQQRLERVEATYAPLGWGAVVVRAAWCPWGHHGVDLQIEAQASTAGALRGFEAQVASHFHQEAEPPVPRWVEPREAPCAALSYDGREPELRRLTTLPPRREAFLSPRLVAGESCGNWLYVEMVHPDDISRRMREGGRTLATAHTTRYALFGHDLEKGVVVRGRLRALWLPQSAGKQEALEQFERFLSEPLPLTT